MLPAFKKLRVSTKLENLNSTAKATLLQNMLLVRGLLFLAMYLMVLWKTGLNEKALVFAFGLNFVSYGFSRSKFYQIGAYIIIVEQTIMIPIVATAKDASATASTISPIWLALAPLVASLVLSVRETLITVLLSTAAIVLIFFKGNSAYADILNMVLVSSFTIAIFSLLSAQVRQKFEMSLEQERAKLTHSSKLASLGQMAAGVAHELNSPLAAILLSAEMIEDEVNGQPNPSQAVLSSTKMIFDVSDRMRKIIHGLKTFSRDASSENIESTQVKDWISGTFSLCQEKFHHDGISLSLSHLNLEQFCDVQAIQVSQALLNLLTNSSEAVSSLKDKWVRVAVELNGSWLEVSVLDSGSGIAAETAAHIFDPFYSTKDYGRGIGLGLSISHEILQRHGGELFYDAKSKNTRFVMRFPINASTIKRTPEAA